MKFEGDEKNRIHAFLQLLHASDPRITSTGAELVNFSAGLYNVTGSTDDPKRIPDHENAAWKALLIAYGISDSSPCYVTNPGAEGSHPNFMVGGHMTTVQSGVVPVGGICYLMPLCKWHNSTSKDGTLFSHSETKMLKLTGYMQGELAATFALRLPSSDPYAMLYHDGIGWNHKNFASKTEADQFLAAQGGKDKVEHHLIERQVSTQTLRAATV